MLENLKKYKIVLASNSPRRRNLLSGLDIDFEVRVISDIDESYPILLTPWRSFIYCPFESGGL